MPKEPEAGAALLVAVVRPLPKEPEAGAGPLPKEPGEGAGKAGTDPDAARPRTGFRDLPKDEGDGDGTGRFLLASKEPAELWTDVEPPGTEGCPTASGERARCDALATVAVVGLKSCRGCGVGLSCRAGLRARTACGDCDCT